MIDDQVRHQLNILPQILYVCPASQAGIDLSVINWVKAGIRAVYRVVEGQQMDAAKQASERTCKATVQCLDVASAKAIYVSNELYSILHSA